MRRSFLTLILTAGALLVAAAPAFAQSLPAGKSLVVLTGRLDVPKGTVVKDAVIFDGDAAIAGSVTNNVVAFNGDVAVSGSVAENVIALNGRVVLSDTAVVGGDVQSRLAPAIAPGAKVGGTIQRTNFAVDFGRLTIVSRLAIWVGTTVSSFILGLIAILFAPRAAESISRTVAERTGAVIGWGLAALIGLPLIGVVALITVVGLPFGVGVLLALALLFWLGYVAGAFALGRRFVRAPRSRVGAFAAGWAILRVIALIPFLAGLTWTAATVVGLGALAVAARRAGRGESEIPAAPEAAQMPPPPPVPA